MGSRYETIDDTLRGFIESQHVFFVGTAPGGSSGHINVSPKGMNALRILGPTAVAYLDYVGSGAETIAHLRDNGRIVIMLCSFEGAPKIVRLHGSGRAIEPQDAEFAALRAHFDGGTGVRAIVHVTLTRISDSCGYGVPQYRYAGERTQLGAWSARKEDAELEAYQRANNAVSIDGLPGLRWTDRR